MANPAPGRLELVQDFVNTLDLEDGKDDLDTPAKLWSWFAERELLAPEDPIPSAAERATALELREGIRAILYSNNTGVSDPVALECLDRCEDNLHIHLRVHLGRERPLVLEAEDGGVQGALGKLLTIVFEAMLDGTWTNFKACARSSCRWAFYDISKNHSGRWCRMATCGNREKVTSYRLRRSAS